MKNSSEARRMYSKQNDEDQDEKSEKSRWGVSWTKPNVAQIQLMPAVTMMLRNVSERLLYNLVRLFITYKPSRRCGRHLSIKLVIIRGVRSSPARLYSEQASLRLRP